QAADEQGDADLGRGHAQICVELRARKKADNRLTNGLERRHHIAEQKTGESERFPCGEQAPDDGKAHQHHLSRRVYRGRAAHCSASLNRVQRSIRLSVGLRSIARRRAASGLAPSVEAFMCRPPPSLANALFEPWLRPLAQASFCPCSASPR